MKTLRRFLDHPFVRLISGFGLSLMAVDLWRGKIERLEYILLAVLVSCFAILAFLEAFIASLEWWFKAKE